MKISTSGDNFLIKSEIFLGRSWKNTGLKRLQEEMRILSYARKVGNISKSCRYFGLFRQVLRLETSLCPGGSRADQQQTLPWESQAREPKGIEEKILYLRKTCHLGHGESSVYRYSRKQRLKVEETLQPPKLQISFSSWNPSKTHKYKASQYNLSRLEIKQK